MEAKEMTHYPINFSPFATNVLDVIERNDLFTPNGTHVTIRRASYGFVIDIGQKHYETNDNLQASYILNIHETGYIDG